MANSFTLLEEDPASHSRWSWKLVEKATSERTLGHACIVDLNSGLALVPEGR